MRVIPPGRDQNRAVPARSSGLGLPWLIFTISESDLRRLRAHGLITRIPKTHRYRISDTGLHHAMLITHIHTRVLQPGLAQLTDPDPPAPRTLRTAARNYQRALDQLTQEAGFAA
jgi:hypothetical protein